MIQMTIFWSLIVPLTYFIRARPRQRHRENYRSKTYIIARVWALIQEDDGYALLFEVGKQLLLQGKGFILTEQTWAYGKEPAINYNSAASSRCCTAMLYFVFCCYASAWWFHLHSQMTYDQSYGVGEGQTDTFTNTANKWTSAEKLKEQK